MSSGFCVTKKFIGEQRLLMSFSDSTQPPKAYFPLFLPQKQGR